MFDCCGLKFESQPQTQAGESATNTGGSYHITHAVNIIFLVLVTISSKVLSVQAIPCNVREVDD